MKSSFPFERVSWTNTIFLASVLLIALFGAPVYVWRFGLDIFQLSLFAFYVVATGMSITLGYHRLFAHRAFQARWPVRIATLVFGACAFENSAYHWVSDHRRHHKHVDHEEDPYNISKGFLWAHIGWILFKLDPEQPMDNVADLRKDRLVMWQHRWVQVIAIVCGLLLPAVLGFLWGGAAGALGAFLLAGIVRVVVVQQCTFFINSLCHTIGRRPYSSRCSARDSWIMALLTFGEGYHNYHHAFKHDYRNGVSRRSFDPTKWTIWLLSKLGLVSNLRRVSMAKIVLAELAEARRHADEHLRLEPEDPSKFFPASVQKTRGMLHDLSERISDGYREIEQSLAMKVEISRHALKAWRIDARRFLKEIAYLKRLQSQLQFSDAVSLLRPTILKPTD